MKIKSLGLLGAIALLLSLVNPLLATTVRRKNFDQLVQEADMVAVGRVQNVHSLPTADRQYVYTYVTVGELEVLKGNYDESQIMLRMDGGDMGDGRRLVVPGIPRFQFNEQVVIFVKGNGQSICPFVGWEQGLLRVVKDEKSGESLLRSSRGQRIHGVRNGAFLISPGEKQAQNQDGVFIVDPDANSAGHTEQGETQQPPQLKAAELQQDLSLGALKQEIHSMLLKAGYRRSTGVRVKSAQIAFESPGLRSDKAKN
jgi:hypothetical protein